MMSIKKPCKHPEAIQFTGTKSQWCPNCGSARIMAKVGKLRWKAPLATRKKRKAA